MKDHDTFRIIAAHISQWTGTAVVFICAVLFIVIWALTGPVFHYSDTWQLVVNTSTTIITFLMVFLIQNTQNRDSKAVQLKLDELIRATKGARAKYVDLEELRDADLAELNKEFQIIAQKPGTVRAINQLHEKIAAEHMRRVSLKSATEKFIGHTTFAPTATTPTTTQPPTAPSQELTKK